LVPAPVDAVPPVAPDSCKGALSLLRAAIVDSERYPPTSIQNAYRRYQDLNGRYQRIATELYWSYIPFPLREVGAQISDQCGSAVEYRFSIYDAWSAVLTNQTDAFLLLADRNCTTLSRSLIRYDIADDATAIAPLAARFGLRDPDIRHVDGLLRSWAAHYQMTLPTLASVGQIERLRSHYLRIYDQAKTASRGAC
jgi:hypothetical protein